MKIVITGGTKGIGRAMVWELAQRGYELAVCARDAKELEKLQVQVRAETSCPEIQITVADLRDNVAISRFADEVLTGMGTPDVLINNAGDFGAGGIQEEEDGLLESMMEINLYSAYYLTKRLLPAMRERGKGHIVNMCSVASQKAYPGGGSYSISKFALLGFGKNLREELKQTGIRVTNILPGATWTDSWAGSDYPEDRLMDAETIARVVRMAIELPDKAVMEEVVVRPQLGDL